MNPQKAKIVIIGILVAIVFFFGLVIKGVIPGLQKNKEAKNPVEATLAIWGMDDDEKAYAAAKEAFKQTHPNLDIAYKKFTDEALYEAELLEALASQRGPDIFMVPSGGLARNREKIVFAPENMLSPLMVQTLFPRVVEDDFVEGGRVGALPLFIDTLALVYNRNMLSQSGVVYPPETWKELEEVAPRLTKKDAEGNIVRAGVALGGTEGTIANAGDIIKLLAFQEAGVRGSQLESAIKDAGANAAKFYKKFASPGSSVYAWREGMPYSLDAFGAGRAAMVFAYAKDLKKISAQNSFIDISVAKVPQKAGTENPITVANYRGLAVSKQSPIADIAWKFVIMLTTNEGVARGYAGAAGRLPALNSLIRENLGNPKWGAFAAQALIARSVRVGDERAEREELENMAKRTQ